MVNGVRDPLSDIHMRKFPKIQGSSLGVLI